jgi:thiol-disulfide isomerase/thioredoxin
MIVRICRKQLVRPIVTFLLALAFGALATVPGAAQSVPHLPEGNGAGDTPDISIRMIQTLPPATAKPEEALQLSSLRGKVVLLDVFSSKCPHCFDHAPHVAELYNQYRQRGLTVLGLATDMPERVEDVKSFIGATKVTYPVGYLTAEVIVYYLDPRNHSVPQMVLFGPDGRMVKRLIGWNETNGRELKAAIEDQLAKVPAAKAPARSGK